MGRCSQNTSLRLGSRAQASLARRQRRLSDVAVRPVRSRRTTVNQDGDASTSEACRGLRGREVECAALDDMITAVRAGHSRTLIVRGDAGVGKTALLNHAVEAAAGLHVLRAGGVESETELAFAALHALCAPVMDRVER